MTETILSEDIEIYTGCMQNRELSWLKFNERVMEEANNRNIPPLERLKFISIFTSNLDEFYMVRVGSLTDYMMFSPKYFDNKTGMTAQEQLDAIFIETSILYTRRDRCYRAIMDDLDNCNVKHMQMNKLDSKEYKRVEKYFIRDVLPLLSPHVINNRSPFPHIDNKQLHICVNLGHRNKQLFGLVAVPNFLDRFFSPNDDFRYLLLEDIILHFTHLIFAPYKVAEKTVIAVTRNADINMEESEVLDEDFDYRSFIKKLLNKRQKLSPVRLELQYPVSDEFESFFVEKLKLKKKQVFVSQAPLDLTFYSVLSQKAEAYPDLVRLLYVPSETYPINRATDLLKLIQKKDILFSYPYESVMPFLEMMRRMANDPAVLSIKITLYRINAQSKLAESLIRAAENGKEVIVLLELRARFDEANNIEWSKRFEAAGCRVIFGLAGYKVHSKICLITRREFGRIQYITQIGTGNYNETTAKQYTDISLFTANQDIGKDAAKLFDNLMLASLGNDYSYLWVAPTHYKQLLIDRIDREQKKAEAGKPGRVILKCNSLTDREIIVKLIEASISGVRISLIIRGICCLVPGIPGFTDNINVISIIGRFLEHSRIFCFGEGNDREIYISSADLMTRNTERRIEVICPVLDEDIKLRIYSDLETMLSGNTRAWELRSDGEYVLLPESSGSRIDSQEFFIEQASKSLRGSSGSGGIPGVAAFIKRIVYRLRRTFGFL